MILIEKKQLFEKKNENILINPVGKTSKFYKNFLNIVINVIKPETKKLKKLKGKTQ